MTQTRVNRQWIYKQRPQNAVGLEHFEMREGAVPKAGGAASFWCACWSLRSRRGNAPG